MNSDDYYLQDQRQQDEDMRYGFRFSRENSFLWFEEAEAVAAGKTDEANDE